MRSLGRFSAALTLLVVLAGCPGERAAPALTGQLRIATGEVGGVYHAYGEGIAAAVRAELPALRPSVLATDASVANLRLLDTGRAEVAFCLANAAADAGVGAGAFPHPVDVVALARLYDNYVQLVVGAQSPIRGLGQLRGRRVSTGAPGSGTDLVADRLLAAAGLRQGADVRAVNLGIEASTRALRDGAVDGFFFFGGIPTPAVAALARTTPVRLVPLGDWVSLLASHTGDNPNADLYTEAVIPKSSYGLTAPVRTVSVPNYLVVRRDMDPELAYRLTRLLFLRSADLAHAHPEARRLSARSAISTYPLDLHPGAARWYREAWR